MAGLFDTAAVLRMAVEAEGRADVLSNRQVFEIAYDLEDALSHGRDLHSAITCGRSYWTANTPAPLPSTASREHVWVERDTVDDIVESVKRLLG